MLGFCAALLFLSCIACFLKFHSSGMQTSTILFGAMLTYGGLFAVAHWYEKEPGMVIFGVVFLLLAMCTLSSDQDPVQEGWEDQSRLSACPGCGRQTSLAGECCRSCGYQLPEGAGQRTSLGDRLFLVLLALGFTATLTFYPTRIRPVLIGWGRTGGTSLLIFPLPSACRWARPYPFGFGPAPVDSVLSVISQFGLVS
jgi:hypothetical protein